MKLNKNKNKTKPKIKFSFLLDKKENAIKANSSNIKICLSLNSIQTDNIIKSVKRNFNLKRNKTVLPQLPSLTSTCTDYLYESHHTNQADYKQTLNLNYFNYKSSTTSTRYYKNIISFAANIHEGVSKNYNEDRISIILNINHPSNLTQKNISFFSIFDGHGGSGCCDFLKDNLHNYILQNEDFPVNIQLAISNAFKKADEDFLNIHSLSNDGSSVKDSSGSCALVVLVVDDIVYVSNVGDSRCLLINEKIQIQHVTNDHKPNYNKEMMRIYQNGGRVYKIIPGRLNVSRSFGDVFSKAEKFGGKENILISQPEIIKMKISEKLKYIFIGSDGIYDKLSNSEINDMIKYGYNVNNNSHDRSGMIVDLIMKTCLKRKVNDNISCIFLELRSCVN